MSVRPEQIRLAVFDCDGTLSDGQAAVCAAMEAAFAVAGLAMPSRHAVRRTVGLSLPYAVREIAPDAAEHEQAAVVEAYKEAFRRSRLEGTLDEPLYEGIAELLGRLKANGWRLGVATGKSDRGLQSCLAAHGIFDLFVTLQTADRHPSKPDPSMLHAAMAEAGAAAADTVMIGDTAYDMAMARAAHCRALGVAWGYHLPAELLAAGAEAVAQTPAELEELLNG
jgi:phosphoglycolate phosphatase